MTYEHISHLNSSVSVADIEQVNVKALEFFLLMTYQFERINFKANHETAEAAAPL